MLEIGVVVKGKYMKRVVIWGRVRYFDFVEKGLVGGGLEKLLFKVIERVLLMFNGGWWCFWGYG